MKQVESDDTIAFLSKRLLRRMLGLLCEDLRSKEKL